MFRGPMHGGVPWHQNWLRCRRIKVQNCCNPESCMSNAVCQRDHTRALPCNNMRNQEEPYLGTQAAPWPASPWWTRQRGCRTPLSCRRHPGGCRTFPYEGCRGVPCLQTAANCPLSFLMSHTPPRPPARPPAHFVALHPMNPNLAGTLTDDPEPNKCFKCKSTPSSC